MTTDPTGAVYIGVATTATPTAPTSYTAYQWSLIKGQDGVPVKKGADGSDFIFAYWLDSDEKLWRIFSAGKKAVCQHQVCIARLQP